MHKNMSVMSEIKLMSAHFGKEELVIGAICVLIVMRRNLIYRFEEVKIKFKIVLMGKMTL